MVGTARDGWRCLWCRGVVSSYVDNMVDRHRRCEGRDGGNDDGGMLAPAWDRQVMTVVEGIPAMMRSLGR